MKENKVGMILTSDMASILVGAFIAYTEINYQIKEMGLNNDPPSTLVLFANALDQLGRAAPRTRTEEVYALASRLLMATEIDD